MICSKRKFRVLRPANDQALGSNSGRHLSLATSKGNKVVVVVVMLFFAVVVVVAGFVAVVVVFVVLLMML